MHKALLLVFTATIFLAACSKSSPPAGSASAPASTAVSGDPVQQKLQQLAGGGAVDCGRVKSQAPDQIKPASDCAMAAAQKKQAFYVGYDMPGLVVGVAGNSEGKLFSIMAEQPEGQPNAKLEPKEAPCPGELRVAGSGRVTCMAAGTGMGGMGGPGGSNPHGGGLPMAMPPGSGENPHGTVGTKRGTANPHAGTGQKIPPKQ